MEEYQESAMLERVLPEQIVRHCTHQQKAVAKDTKTV